MKRTLIPAAVVAIAVLGLAGCSLPFPGTKASANNSSSQTDNRQQMLKFAQCMRQHGVDVPDPGSGGNIVVQGHDAPGTGTDLNSSSFEAAQNACKKYLPSGGAKNGKVDAAMQRRALQFSQCMRAHGLPDFPDPQFSGGGIALGGPPGSTGIDPQSPTFQAAQSACQHILGTPGKDGPTTIQGGVGGGNGPTTSIGGK